MRKVMIILLVALFVFCPWIKATYAGKISAHELSQTEVENLASAEADSASTVLSVIGGDDDYNDKREAAAVFLIALLIVAATAAIVY